MNTKNERKSLLVSFWNDFLTDFTVIYMRTFDDENTVISVGFTNSLIEIAVIIIPTHNEELIIAETIEKVFNESRSASSQYDIHILVFDSASTDNTCGVVRALQSTYRQLHLQTESRKTGLGSAYHQAMKYALHTLRAAVIVEFDADLSHQPKYLVPMLKYMKTTDVVVGSRYIDGGGLSEDWEWHRRSLSKFGNKIIKLMLSMPYFDLTSGFRMIRRDALIKALPTEFISSQFAYKIELYWHLHKTGSKILEFPIQFINRSKGQSKLPKGSVIDFLSVLFELNRKRFLKRF